MMATSNLFQYSDATYICALIAASACATVSTAPPERGELLQYEPDTEQDAEDADLLQRSKAEVERYRSMDRLIPSAHNLVTVAALEVSNTHKPSADIQEKGSSTFLLCWQVLFQFTVDCSSR